MWCLTGKLSSRHCKFRENSIQHHVNFHRTRQSISVLNNTGTHQELLYRVYNCFGLKLHVMVLRQRTLALTSNMVQWRGYRNVQFWQKKKKVSKYEVKYGGYSFPIEIDDQLYQPLMQNMSPNVFSHSSRGDSREEKAPCPCWLDLLSTSPRPRHPFVHGRTKSPELGVRAHITSSTQYHCEMASGFQNWPINKKEHLLVGKKKLISYEACSSRIQASATKINI